MVKTVSPETESALKEARLWLDSYTAEDVLDNLPHAIHRKQNSLYLTMHKRSDGTYGVGYYGTEGLMIIALPIETVGNLAEEAGKLWLYLRKKRKDIASSSRHRTAPTSALTPSDMQMPQTALIPGSERS